MVTEIRYTSIHRVLDGLLDHPMLSDLSLEQAVRYTLRFVSLFSYPKLFQDKIDNVKIHEFRGVLPCDLISIVQVKDMDSNICLRAITDSFTPGLGEMPPHEAHYHHDGKVDMGYIPPIKPIEGELAFKTQGRIIYTSFPEGMVEIAYKSIPVDEDGFPLLIDNETYLNALEAYIKKQIFTVKFDQQKISAAVLQNAQRDYALAAANLDTEFTTPSYSEAEAMSRFMTSLIPSVRKFERGFKHLGDRQFIKNH